MSIEKRVHPIPFRTRKLSASSPMILRIFTWESRPMPRLSLERLLFRSLSLFALSESMTVCRGLTPLYTQGKGKYDFQGCHVVVKRVEEAGLGSASFTCARALVCCMNDGCCLTTSLFPPASERHRTMWGWHALQRLLENALPGSSVFTVVR